MEVNIFKKKFLKIIGSKKRAINVHRIKAHYSIISGYVCIGFIDFVWNNNIQTDFTYLVSLDNFFKNIFNNSKLKSQNI